MWTDTDYRYTLAWVNHQRKRRGHPPLAALPLPDTRRCPVEQGIPGCISAGAHTIKLHHPTGQEHIPTPEPLARFLRKFDEGAYPDLLPDWVAS